MPLRVFGTERSDRLQDSAAGRGILWMVCRRPPTQRTAREKALTVEAANADARLATRTVANRTVAATYSRSPVLASIADTEASCERNAIGSPFLSSMAKEWIDQEIAWYNWVLTINQPISTA